MQTIYCLTRYYILHLAFKIIWQWTNYMEMWNLQVQACGSMVTEEQPHAMLIPIEYFLMGYGLYRQTLSLSPRSPLSPSCISPELLSPESMGLKLKPIKTRISLEVWHKMKEKGQDHLFVIYICKVFHVCYIFWPIGDKKRGLLGL